jgi:mannose-1-phosphate guanylyltransferase
MVFVERDSTCSAASRVETMAPSSNRWGIVLAGGEGWRPESDTRFSGGDDRGRQFGSIAGARSVLEEAVSRAQRSIPEEQTIVALTAGREPAGAPQVSCRVGRRLIQPFDRGTAPAIIVSLFQIIERNPDAVVGILPWDHSCSDESAFTQWLEAAFRAAKNHPESAILLGGRPDRPEANYGWIELGPANGRNLFRVRGFQEQPNRAAAERLFRAGGLWNTSVVVGRAVTFLRMSLGAAPELFAELADTSMVSNDGGDIVVPQSLYARIPEVDFSRQVLVPNAFRLLAMPLNGMKWRDLRRMQEVAMQGQRLQPQSWIQVWKASPRRAWGRLTPWS